MPEENEYTYWDAVPLSAGTVTSYETDSTKNIYTRSMVRDVNAAGYATESATITSGQRFTDIDTAKFDKKFSQVYHEAVLNGEFVSDISSYYDSSNHTIQIIAATGSNTYLIVEGEPTNKKLLAELEKWGITISSPFGVLYYRVSNGARASSVQTIELTTQQEFSSLCNANDSWSIQIGDVTIDNDEIIGVEMPDSVSSVGNNFLRNCENLTMALDTSHLTSIGQHFLAGCSSFNQPLDLSHITTLPNNFLYECHSFNSDIDISNVTSIGNAFLMCKAYNQPITFSSSLTSIGQMFMWGTHAFNQNITIPASVTSIGGHFMTQIIAMCSTVNLNCPPSVFVTSDPTADAAVRCFETSNQSNPAYATGIYIGGPYRSQWLALWPDNSHRNLR